MPCGHGSRPVVSARSTQAFLDLHRLFKLSRTIRSRPLINSSNALGRTIQSRPLIDNFNGRVRGKGALVSLFETFQFLWLQLLTPPLDRKGCVLAT